MMPVVRIHARDLDQAHIPLALMIIKCAERKSAVNHHRWTTCWPSLSSSNLEVAKNKGGAWGVEGGAPWIGRPC